MLLKSLKGCLGPGERWAHNLTGRSSSMQEGSREAGFSSENIFSVGIMPYHWRRSGVFSIAGGAQGPGDAIIRVFQGREGTETKWPLTSWLRVALEHQNAHLALWLHCSKPSMSLLPKLEITQMFFNRKMDKLWYHIYNKIQLSNKNKETTDICNNGFISKACWAKEARVEDYTLLEGAHLSQGQGPPGVNATSCVTF